MTSLRSLELPLHEYPTDKVTRGLLRYYDPIFAPWVGKPISLLELGIHCGGSLSLWRDYFPLGTIVGIDSKVQDFELGERIYTFEGKQEDRGFLSRVANEVAPDGFDIIIDDCSHVGWMSKQAFWHLFDNHLKPDGLYVIEDWGTGYLDDWTDGKRPDAQKYSTSGPEFQSHNYGMVGLIKQLIDKLITRTEFDHMVISPCVVFIRKIEASAR